MCKDPNCPHTPQPFKVVPPTNDPQCICSKPLLLYIPPGEHVHCPVHPAHVIHGSNVTC